MEKTYLILAQSRPAGHRSAPVRSWLKPLADFMFWGIWGFKLWPFGVIQSMMALFTPFVSSARAPLIPFCIYLSRSKISLLKKFSHSPAQQWLLPSPLMIPWDVPPWKVSYVGVPWRHHIPSTLCLLCTSADNLTHCNQWKLTWLSKIHHWHQCPQTLIQCHWWSEFWTLEWPNEEWDIKWQRDCRISKWGSVRGMHRQWTGNPKTGQSSQPILGCILPDEGII